MSLFWPTVAAIAWGLIVAFAGGMLTTLGPWYDQLKRPRLQPPDWLFGPAWTLIFALSAAAAVLAWRDAPNEGARFAIVALFVVNGALNILWNVFFFGQHRPDRALVEVSLLWLSILAPIVFFWSFQTVAALLLLPYLLWVAFASYLNAEIVRLNGPFVSSSAKPTHEIDDMGDAGKGERGDDAIPGCADEPRVKREQKTESRREKWRHFGEPRRLLCPPVSNPKHHGLNRNNSERKVSNKSA